MQPGPVHSRVVTRAVCRAILDKNVNVFRLHTLGPCRRGDDDGGGRYGETQHAERMWVVVAADMEDCSATTYDRPRETLPKR